MKAFLITLCLLFSNFLSAQSNNFDQRLLEKFTQDELENMKINNQIEFNTINYSMDHGYYFVDIPKTKDYNERLSGEVVINDLNNFNFLLLNIDFLEADYQYFKVRNMDKLLVVKSSDHINEELNQ